MQTTVSKIYKFRVMHHMQRCSLHCVFTCSGEELCSMEGFTFDTRAEDLRHVWIPLTLKMSISKSQGLEISSWPEGEEVKFSSDFWI